jgi:HEAT repeat protein
MAFIMELANALKQEDPETRVRILKALMELKDPRATPSLLEALDDCCLDVRRAAMRALSWIGDERARPAFIKALREGDFSLRFWAAIGLQKVGDEGSVEGLIGALKDPDECVRLQAVYALAGIGDRRAIEPLLAAVDNDFAVVQEAARDNLREAFEVDVSRGYEEAARLLSERNARLCKLNRRLEKVLNVVGRLEGESGEVLDEDLYRVLFAEQGFDEDEAIGLVVELISAGLVYTPRPGYTRIGV